MHFLINSSLLFFLYSFKTSKERGKNKLNVRCSAENDFLKKAKMDGKTAFFKEIISVKVLQKNHFLWHMKHFLFVRKSGEKIE